MMCALPCSSLPCPDPPTPFTDVCSAVLIVNNYAGSGFTHVRHVHFKVHNISSGEDSSTCVGLGEGGGPDRAHDRYVRFKVHNVSSGEDSST